MNEALKAELAEFENLVDEVKGDCDRCKMTCRDRLRIMDSQIEALRQERTEFTALVTMLKDTLGTYHPHTFERQLNTLTASLLAQSEQAKNYKGRHNDKENSEISAWD